MIDESNVLKCYSLDDEEWVVAYSVEDAAKVYEESWGSAWESAWGEDIDRSAEEMGGDETLTITDETGEETVKETKTIDEWIALRGRGILASENW